MLKASLRTIGRTLGLTFHKEDGPQGTVPNDTYPDIFGPREFVKPAGRPVFAVGTGRCGTHFFAKLFKQDPLYLAKHADDVYPVADAFHRFCVFHNLPVDEGGLVWSRRCLVDEAARRGKMYFESNGILSFNIGTLQKELSAAVILVVRNPLAVITSYTSKGLYRRWFAIDDTSRPAGFQYNTSRANHSFSTLIPCGESYDKWNDLTEAGKTAWLWHTVNSSVLDLVSDLSDEEKKIVRIEDFDYAEYLRLGSIMKLSPLSEEIFDATRASRPGKTGNKRPMRSLSDWTEKERDEVRRIAGKTAARLGYDLDAEF